MMARAPYRAEKIAARRTRVAALLSQGFTITEIAKFVDCSVRTVTGDIHAVRSETAAAIRTSAAETIGAEFLEGARTRQRSLWHLYARAANDLPPADGITRQLAVLREVRAASEGAIEVLQSLGLAYRAPSTASVDVRVRAADLLSRVPPTVLERVVEMTTIDAIRNALLAFLTGPEVESVIADMMPTNSTGPVRTISAATS